jgi:hypothetical protein
MTELINLIFSEEGWITTDDKEKENYNFDDTDLAEYIFNNWEANIIMNKLLLVIIH